MLFVLLLATLWTRTAVAAKQPPLDADKIKAALETAAPEEDGFVDTVIQLVNEGKLSRSLVESTFLWARKKSTHRFQYFRRGLLSRLAARHQQLPTPSAAASQASTSPTAGNGLFAFAIGAADWLLQRFHLAGPLSSTH